MAADRKNVRLQRTRSMKSELSQLAKNLSYAAAAGAVQAYAKAGFEAFVMCLPAVTMITRLNATMSADTLPGFIEARLVNHGKGGAEKCLEHDPAGEEKGTMKTAWKYRLGKAIENVDNSSVEAAVTVKNKQTARSLVQSSHAGSRSKVKTQKLRFYSTRMADEEPLLAAIIERTGARNISLVGIHLERIKNNIDANFMQYLQERLDAGEFRRIVRENMA